MGHPSSDGAAAGNSVQIAIDRIREIGTRTVGDIEQATSDGTQTFRGIDATSGHWSQVPQAQEFFAMQQDARQNFLDTIDAIVSDLENLGSELVASARNHEQADDAIAAALSSFGQSFDSTPLQTDTTYDEGISRSEVDVSDLDLDDTAQDDGSGAGNEGPAGSEQPSGSEGAGTSGSSGSEGSSGFDG